MDTRINQMIGTDTSGQVISGLVIVIIIILVFLTAQFIYTYITNSRNRFHTLVDYTANAEDMTLTIRQDASKYPDAKPVGLSINERTGIEFSYSLYMYINSSTFTGNSTYKHVFHKGYSTPWPLMGPGVFVHSDTNTLRVMMNTYKNPYTYADVKNIPVQKWFHLVLNCYKGGLDIFVNGNLANRIPFTNTLPYQNFQDIILFSSSKINSLRGSSIPSLGDEDFQLEGSFNGYVSNFTYARYALSVQEIQNMMTAGPSSKLKQKALDKPPYMGDDWWAHSS